MRSGLILLVTASLLVVQGRPQSSVALAVAQDASHQTAVPTNSALQERLLVTLPPDVEVKAGQLPYSLLFGRDGRQVAYFVRYRVGDLFQEAVMVGDARGPETTFLAQAALSPDGSKVAYLASFREDIKAAYLIVGNRRDQVQIREVATDPHWVPVFSPDGRKLAYKAETPSGKHVIRVAAVSEIPPDSHTDNRSAPLSSVSGPEFDDVDQPQFSADSNHVTYAARDRGKWTIVVDGRRGLTFDDAADPVFRPDGLAVAYRATRDKKKYFAVVGSQEGPRFDMVSRIAFSPDGARLAYGAQERGKAWVVVGAERRPAFHLADEVVFSSDGTQVVYWKIERGGGTERLIVNDRIGPKFDKIGHPVFDDSATVAAYWARDKAEYVMVAGERRSERFDGVGRTRVFSADGSELGFGVLQGNELRWRVLKTR